MKEKAVLIAALGALAAVLAVPAAGMAATPGVAHTQFGPLSYHWPVKPFDRQHPIRGGFGDPRTVSPDEPFGLTGPNESGSYSFHNGVDIVAPTGTPVYPVVSGRVARALPDEIVIDTYDGRAFQYYHLSKARNIQRGAKVVVDRTVLGWIRNRFGHVHLSELDGHVIHNPLDYGHLEPYDDSTRPVATEVYLDNGQPTSVAGRAIHPRDPLAVAAYDPPAMDVPGEWSGLPQAPALVEWRLFHAGAYTPWQVVVDFRSTEPPAREFWSVYAPGSYQNHPTFDHRLFDNPGRYLFRINLTGDLQPGLYRLQVQVADVRRNHSTTTWALQITKPLPASEWTRRSASFGARRLSNGVYLVASALLPRRFSVPAMAPQPISSEGTLVPRGGLD
jgi:murein DD-endopeptidase MepM/ murein hydrolase activator NlpD